MKPKSSGRTHAVMKGVGVFALSALLAACSQSGMQTLPSAAQDEAVDAGVEAAEAGNQQTVTWDCDGQMIPALFMDGAVLLDLPDGTSVTLPIAMSGSGARYTDGTVTYWEHQGTARIETPTQSWEDCQRASA